MITNLVIGLSTMIGCLILQSLILVLAVRYYANYNSIAGSPTFLSKMIMLNIIMMLLVFGNLMQLTIWAILFLMLGEFNTISEAIYHSAVNFATLGYGDIVMSDKHKLLGPLEAINGVLMIGVTTAVLMAAVRETIKKTIDEKK